MSEAELHIIRARLRGGILNKARRGELEIRPPVGLIYRPDGKIVLDPNIEVQGAIRMLFDTFDRTASAMKTTRFLREQGLQFPSRLQSGPNKGELVWMLPAHSRILQILHNPRYAGAFVFGRMRVRRRTDGGKDIIKLPREEWQFVIKGAHPGYIDWERFEANQQRLTDNGRAFRSDRRSGPPAKGRRCCRDVHCAAFAASGWGLSTSRYAATDAETPLTFVRNTSSAVAVTSARRCRARRSMRPSVPSSLSWSPP